MLKFLRIIVQYTFDYMIVYLYIPKDRKSAVYDPTTIDIILNARAEHKLLIIPVAMILIQVVSFIN